MSRHNRLTKVSEPKNRFTLSYPTKELLLLTRLNRCGNVIITTAKIHRSPSITSSVKIDLISFVTIIRFVIENAVRSNNNYSNE